MNDTSQRFRPAGVDAQAHSICMQARDDARAYEPFVAKQRPVFEGD
jgi:hypothetical protein